MCAKFLMTRQSTIALCGVFIESEYLSLLSLIIHRGIKFELESC